LAVQGVGMDSLREFLEAVRQQGTAQGNFRGLLHLLVGRSITRSDGTVVSSGLTWRDLAALLKRLRWDPDTVRELGLDPAHLAPRDRQRFWYSAITQAQIDAAPARTAAEQLIEPLQTLGYVVSPGPGAKPPPKKGRGSRKER
jgi:hypothetical protein